MPDNSVDKEVISISMPTMKSNKNGHNLGLQNYVLSFNHWDLQPHTYASANLACRLRMLLTTYVSIQTCEVIESMGCEAIVYILVDFLISNQWYFLHSLTHVYQKIMFYI